MKFNLIALVFLCFSINATATEFPETIRVRSHYVSPSSPTILEDEDGTMVALFGASIDAAAMNPDPHDFLDLKHAESKEFLSPVLGGCNLLDYSFDFLGPGTQIFQVGGRDAKGTKACQKFVKSLTGGFQMKFTNVPLLNRHAVIKTVLVEITTY